MEIGKLPHFLLKEIVMDNIKHNRKEVILRPEIGEDCSALDLNNHLCVLSSDPITGAANEIGRLAVHISCNDVAACGAEPIGLLVTLLAPPDATEKDLRTIMSQVSSTANELNVDILGGHTEITASVTRFVIITTAVGKTIKSKLVTSSGAKAGDAVILTKTAGVEGTAIIAHDKEEELIPKLGRELVDRAKSFINKISVIPEGMIASKLGANAMHDVTEGGVLGAVWEVAEASKKGVVIYEDKIPIAEETEKICRLYSIDPLRLISSGCMIITSSEGDLMVRELEANGIMATIIGTVTESPERLLFNGNKATAITPPGSDEIYKIT